MKKKDFIAVIIGTIGTVLVLVLEKMIDSLTIQTAEVMILIIIILESFYIIYRIKSAEKRVLSNLSQFKDDMNDLLESKGDTITWYTFWHDVQLLENKIKNDDFIPDLIIGIGRSGAIASALLAGNLGEIKHISIDRTHEHRSDGRRETKIYPSFSKFKEYFEEKIVLIVMAECAAGGTLKRAIQDLNQLNPKEIRTAVVYRYSRAEFMPSYVAINNTSERRLIFRKKSWKRSSRRN